MQESNQQILFASRPIGWVSDDNFRFVTRELLLPENSGVLVKNIYLSVDPYMRGRMSAQKSYAAGFELGKVLSGGGIGQVTISHDPKLKVGDFVTGHMGWEEISYFPDASGLQKLDPKLAPLSYNLGVLGMPGMTAYVGLLDIGKPESGETVYVSAASGAVGQLVGQIAKMKGCRVVGSAGSEAKVRYLTDELGYDAAFNYRLSEDLQKSLEIACPGGIDVYFENVGGEMLDAVLATANPFARIVACGMISQYNLRDYDGIKNLVNIVRNRIRMQGFIVSDHGKRRSAFLRDVGKWLKEGRITYREDIVRGLENMPAAFVGMMKGDNMGKRVVQIADDPTK